MPIPYHDLLTQIFDLYPGYIFWKDLQSRYLGCNRNFSNFLGFAQPKEILGKDDTELPWQLPGDQAESFQNSDQRTLSGHYVIHESEKLVIPDRPHLTVRVTKKPLYNDGGGLCGIVGYATAIHLPPGLEQQLKKDAAKMSTYKEVIYELKTQLERLEHSSLKSFQWFQEVSKWL